MAQNQKVRKKEKEGRERVLRDAIGSTLRLYVVRTSLDHSPMTGEMEKREITPLFLLGEKLPETYWPCYPLSSYLMPVEHPWLQRILLRFPPTLAKRSQMLWICQCYDEWQMRSLAVAAPNFKDSGCLSKVSTTSPRLDTSAFYLDLMTPLGNLLQKVNELPR